MVSREHGICVQVDLASGAVSARQINRSVPLTEPQRDGLRRLAEQRSSSRFNIPPEHIGGFLAGTLDSTQLIPDPISVLFFSSHGLLNGSSWTSNQPSEGIWVLAEWLSRKSPAAAPVCIDPNLLGERELDDVLDRFGVGRVLLGFSVLPVNLKNDARLICRVKSKLPESVAMIGGVGSDSLSLIPTKDGKQGVDLALPVDLIIPGSAVLELEAIVRVLHEGSAPHRDSLRAAYAEIVQGLHAARDIDWTAVTREIQKSRQIARKVFVPMLSADLVHPVGYQEANLKAVDGEAVDVASVLINNECDQGCYFCASPKTKVIAGLVEAVEYISQKARESKVIAFNDNDLSNDPAGTVALCNALVEAGITHPKHGKMRADRYIPELLEALSRANFVRMAVGVESFSQDVRNKIGKANFQLSTIEQTLQRMLELGIVPEINLILFTPHETRESLRETIERSLYWVKQGASLYVTVGLFATPNSPGVAKLLRTEKVSNKIRFTELFFEGMRSPLIFPTQWKASEEMEALSGELLEERRALIADMNRSMGVEMSVPIEAYVITAMLARRFEMEGFATKPEMMANIHEYARRERVKQYISI